MSKRQSINPPLNIYKKIALSFIILTLILVMVILYFTFSYTYISIFPKQEIVTTDFNFIIIEDDSQVNDAEGFFQGVLVNQTISGEKKFATTGKKQRVVESDVVGQVEITNELSRQQPLVATTRLLSSDGVLFRLKKGVIVPANSSLIADVYADDPQKPLAFAQTKFTIPGLSESLQEVVYANAVSDFSAQGDFVTAISLEELDINTQKLADELVKDFFATENNKLAKILKKEIISTEYSNKVGEEVGEYTIKAEVKVAGVMFEESMVKKYAFKLLTELVPEGKKLVASTNQNLVYEIENYDTANNLAQIKSSISGVAVISGQSSLLDKDKLFEFDMEGLENYLENQEEIESIEINFSPNWLKRLPYFKDHLIVRIK